jgi:hypothetical protein
MLNKQGETGPGYIPIPLAIVMYEDEIRKEDKRILLGAAYLVYLYGREVSNARGGNSEPGRRYSEEIIKSIFGFSNISTPLPLF